MWITRSWLVQHGATNWWVDLAGSFCWASLTYELYFSGRHRSWNCGGRPALLVLLHLLLPLLLPMATRPDAMEVSTLHLQWNRIPAHWCCFAHTKPLCCRKNTKLRWQLERDDLDSKPPVQTFDQESEVSVKPPPEPVIPVVEPIVEEPPPPEPSPEPEVEVEIPRTPTPPPHEVEYEPEEKEAHRPHSLIVAAITASIEEKHALSDDYSYESVQHRGGTLPRIDEQNRLSSYDERPESSVYSEPQDSLPRQQMNVLNVTDNNGSLRSGISFQHRGDDDNSRVHSMVRSFHNLSRTNSDVSSSNRETIYSRPDMYRKSAKKDPISLAEFMKREKTPSESAPSIPPKEYDSESGYGGGLNWPAQGHGTHQPASNHASLPDPVWFTWS